MNYCPECGDSVNDNDIFCANCGKKLEQKQIDRRKANTGGNRRRNAGQEKQSQERDSVIIVQIIGLLSAGLAVAGTFLSWMEVELLSGVSSTSASATGIEINLGILVLASGCTAGLIFISKDRVAHLFAGICGVGILIGMIAFLNDPLFFQSNLHDIEYAVLSEVVEVRMGAYLSLIGGAGVSLSAILSLIVGD